MGTTPLPPLGALRDQVLNDRSCEAEPVMSVRTAGCSTSVEPIRILTSERLNKKGNGIGHMNRG